MPTITEKIARWAAEVRYEHLNPAAIDAAKRFLYDTLGCALGGAQVHDCKIFLEHYRGLQQPGSCTVIGSGDKMNPVAAAMLNALMVRAMDYNDIYWKQDPSHPSDLASAPLAIAEWKHLSGKDLLLGLVLGWDFTMRLCHIAVPGIRERGWHHATLMAYATPVVAGKMLGLSWQQIQHAIGIAACHRFTLGCAVAGKLTMMKNTVSPMATRDGVEAALLAQRGYTGPEGVFEGKEGMEHCLSKGYPGEGKSWDYTWITDKLGSTLEGGNDPANGIGWMITQCGMKGYPIEALMHSPVSATLHIMKANNLKAEDVKSVLIESIARAADILSDPAKYDPQSKESADHSLPYCIAAALAEGRVTPLEFKEDKLWDKRLRAQMPKVKVVANPEFEKAFPAKQCTRVTITTNDGKTFTHAMDYPKGDPRDPMTVEEIGVKFNALASPIMSESRQQALKAAIFDLENMKDVAELMKLTVADK
ncbi:MAG TPA: MmgE/PrpD family protein [Phycisphaerae bacterium]|jgi:2-methylcitrate dehydratase|nr:MmgE/PrpD family protein [Phycisphaerae bacterium]